MLSDKVRADINAEIDTLRALLDGSARRRRFPDALEKDFHAHMYEEGLRLNSEGWWALLLVVPVACLAIRVLVTQLSSPGFVESNLKVADMAMALEGIFALTILVMARLPAVRTLYPLYTLFAWGGAIATTAIATSAFTDPYLNSIAGFVTSIIILLVYALGVFSVRLSILSGLGGTLLAYVVVRAQGYWFDAGYFFGYAILPNAVGILVAILIEVRDRKGFLQARLLAAEKILVDRYAAEVEHLSRHDPLTGLANRRHFNDALEQAWNLARRQQQTTALLFIDVDYFKPFNDTYGHQQGDRVLAAIGVALSESINRPSDLAARYGGEEFVILLPDTTLDGAHEIATRVAARVEALGIAHVASKVADRLTVSIGVAAQVPGDDNNSAHLVAAADTAVYAAKSAGRNQIRVAGAASP